MPTYAEAQTQMDKSIEALRREFNSVRTGKASPTLLDTVRVDAYGSKMPLNQVASVSSPEPRMLLVQPWDKGLMADIEKAIRNSELGLNPANDGNIIRVPVPALNEERRREMVKVLHRIAEEGRIAVRHARQEANKEIKRRQSENEMSEDDARREMDRIQKLTDEHISRVDSLLKSKEEEVMEVLIVDLETIVAGGCVPAHVAVIMDGNGRWAKARGLPRFRGHTAGIKSVRDTIEGAIEAGVQVLTLFTFSQENWSRPAAEVEALMQLLRRFARQEREELKRQGVEVHVLGERDRLSAAPRRAVDQIEEYTRGGTRLRLNLMISYGGRAEIARAARLLAEQVARGELAPDDIDESTFAGELYTAGLPDPDLLIRTSGEQRISNFLLWQVAYTELFVTPVLWPDFRREHLFQAILDYQRRERRFGRVTAG